MPAMLPREDLITKPALEFGGRFAGGQGHLCATALVRVQQAPDGARINHLVARDHQHVAVEAHALKNLRRLARGVARPQRFFLKSVDCSRKALIHVGMTLSDITPTTTTLAVAPQRL